MAFDWDSFNSEYGQPVEQAPIEVQETVEPEVSPYAPNRGLLGDIGSGLARAGLGLTNMAAEGFEWMGLENTWDEKIDKAKEDYDIFKPDEDEYNKEGIFSGLTPGAFTEGLSTSLGAAAPGAAVGGLVAGPVGAIVGGLASTLLTFGAGSAQERKEELMANGYSEEEADYAGWKTFAIEGGIEGVATGIDLMTAGGGAVVTQIAKQGLKSTVRNLTKLTGKDALKKVAIIMGTENVTEQIQSELGRQEELTYGLATENLSLEDRAENFITTSAMSLLFGGAAVGYTSKQKSDLRKKLESKNPVVSAIGANQVTEDLKRSGDVDLAKQWKDYTDSKIRAEQPIKLDDNFVKVSDQVQGKGTGLADISNADPLISKNAVDNVLKGAGIQEDGSINVDKSYEFEQESMRRKSLQESKGKIEGTKESLRAREIQEGRQAVEAKRAKRDLAAAPTMKDPIVALEEGMVDQYGKDIEVPKPDATRMVTKGTKPGTMDAKASARAFQEAGPTRMEKRMDVLETPEAGAKIAESIQKEDDIKGFEEASKRYVRDKNNKRTIEDFFSSSDANKQRKMFTLMKELDADTNNVLKVTEEDVVVELKKISEGKDTGKMEEIKGTTILAPKKDSAPELATTLTPEDQLINKEAKESGKLIEEDATDPKALEAAAKSDATKALLSGDWIKIKEYLSTKKAGSREGAIVDLMKELPPEVTKNNISYLSTVLQKAKAIAMPRKVNEISGATKFDAISWTKGSGNQQVGYHKDSGLETEISKNPESGLWDVIVDGEIKESIQNKTEARQAVESYVEPLSKESLEALDKRGPYGTEESTTDTAKIYKELGTQRKALDETKEGSTKEEAPKTTTLSPAEKAKLMAQYGGKVVKKATKAEIQAEKEVAGMQGKKEAVPTLDVQKDLTAIEDGTYESMEEDAENLADSISMTSKGALDAIETFDYMYQGKGLTPTEQEARDLLVETRQIEVDGKAKVAKKVTDKFPNSLALLEYAAKSGDNATATLSKFLLKFPHIRRKLVNTPVAYGAKNSFNGTEIIINSTAVGEGTAIHEAVHGITANEMKGSGPKAAELRTRLDEMLDVYRFRVKMNDKFPNLNESMIDKIVAAKTSIGFKKNIGLPAGTERSIAYSMLNRDEFLSQAFGNPEVRDMMKQIQVEKPQKLGSKSLKSLWDLFVNTVRKSLGLKPDTFTMLDEVLTMVPELAGIKTKASKMEAMEAMPTKEEKIAKLEEGEAKYFGKGEAKVGLKGKVKDLLKKGETEFSKTFQSTYEALKTIDLSLAEPVRKMESDINKETKRRVEDVNPFVKKYNKLEAADKERLNFYLKNTDEIYRERRDAILNDNDMMDEYHSVEGTFNEVFAEADKFGLNAFDQEEGYFPRYVKDYEGLVSYLRKQEDWGSMEEALQVAEDKAKKAGITMGTADKAQVLTDILTTGRIPTAVAKTPTALKKRTVQTLSPGMDQFYEDSVASLGKYISEMTEKIEVNRMLGSTGRKATISEMRTKLRQIDKKKTDAGKQKLLDELEVLANKLPGMEAVQEEGIGNIMAQLVAKKEISTKDQERAKDLLRARVTQQGTGRIVSNIRTAALVGSLTQLTTGVRQLSDHVWSVYQNGPMNTLKAAIQVGTGKTDIKDNPFDFQHPLKEFQSNPKGVDMALKMSGLQFMDNFGKKVSMQATMNKAKSGSRETFNKRWEPIFGENTEQVYQDLQDGKQTEDTNYLLFSSISDYQPISLSEMPQRYLKAGNGRIFYLLKSYSIKSANNMYRESIQKIRNGDVKGGMKNLMYLGSTFTMMNASTDWLIDWLLGREPDMTDSMMDSLLTLGMTSRYTMSKGEKDGILKGQLGDMLPPTAIVDYPVKDLWNLLNGEPTMKSLRLLPGFGNLIYSHLTDEGRTKTLRNNRKTIINDIEDGIIDRKTITEYNKEIRGYNREIERDNRKRKRSGKPVKGKIGKIDALSIRNARKKSRKNPSMMKMATEVLETLGPKSAQAADQMEYKTGNLKQPTFKLINKHATRLKVKPDVAMKNMTNFANFVGHMESGNNLKAKNVPQKGKEASSASGKYQFVNESIKPAINRLERTLGMEDWMKELLVHKDITKLNDEQQTLVFLGDLLEKDGSDKYMKKIMSTGDSKAMLQAYYKLHHTNPDVATRKRALKIIKEYN